MKVFYQNSWCIGIIDYSNDEYRVSYPDGTNYYIGLEEIDGIGKLLL